MVQTHINSRTRKTIRSTSIRNRVVRSLVPAALIPEVRVTHELSVYINGSPIAQIVASRLQSNTAFSKDGIPIGVTDIHTSNTFSDVIAVLIRIYRDNGWEVTSLANLRQ